MFTQFLAHGSVPLTVVLLVLTTLATYVVFRVLTDFAVVVGTKPVAQQSESGSSERHH